MNLKSMLKNRKTQQQSENPYKNLRLMGGLEVDESELHSINIFFDKYHMPQQLEKRDYSLVQKGTEIIRDMLGE